MSRLWGQLANYFNYNQALEEQRLLSESFFVSFWTIFVLVMSKWTPCTILPKIRLLCVVLFSNVCDSKHLLVQSLQVEAQNFSASSFQKLLRCKILIDSSCNQNFYLCQKSTHMRLYSKFVLIKKIAPYIHFQHKKFSWNNCFLLFG